MAAFEAEAEAIYNLLRLDVMFLVSWPQCITANNSDENSEMECTAPHSC